MHSNLYAFIYYQIKYMRWNTYFTKTRFWKWNKHNNHYTKDHYRWWRHIHFAKLIIRCFDLGTCFYRDAIYILKGLIIATKYLITNCPLYKIHSCLIHAPIPLDVMTVCLIPYRLCYTLMIPIECSDETKTLTRRGRGKWTAFVQMTFS